MAAERQFVQSDIGDKVIRYVITDTRRLRVSTDPRDRLLRIALSGIQQFNTRLLMESVYRRMYGDSMKDLMTRTVQCFEEDLQSFQNNFPGAYEQLTSDPSTTWSKEDIKNLCTRENLRIKDVLGAEVFYPPMRYSGAFAVAPLMVGVLDDGSLVESGIPYGSEAPRNVVGFRLSDFFSEQRGMKRKATVDLHRTDNPVEREFTCPCGCGVTGGCPCGCPTPEEHNKKAREEAVKKMRPNNMDGHCQLARAVMEMGEGHELSTTDIKDVVARFNIRPRGEKLMQVNMTNLSLHRPGLNGLGQGYSRFSSIFCRDDDDGLFTLHPVFFSASIN
jgi:hypothetical protein